jgi:hypothetical protein
MIAHSDQKVQMVVQLSDGQRSRIEIAAKVGASAKWVGKVQMRLGLPRLSGGARAGANNHQFVSGRRVDPDGYVLITVPSDHPYARKRAHRETKLMFEHRWVMEQKLGRYLLPAEVVDHIDGLTLHNAPENLRLYQSNADHLADTISGRQKEMSAQGREKLQKPRGQIAEYPVVDSYGQRRKAGDVRLRQILLAALKLGADSQYLWGTSHHTKKAGIDLSDRSKIELALDNLSSKWALGQTLL